MTVERLLRDGTDLVWSNRDDERPHGDCVERADDGDCGVGGAGDCALWIARFVAEYRGGSNPMNPVSATRIAMPMVPWVKVVGSREVKVTPAGPGLATMTMSRTTTTLISRISATPSILALATGLAVGADRGVADQ